MSIIDRDPSGRQADAEETAEWIESFDGLFNDAGVRGTEDVLNALVARAEEHGVPVPTGEELATDYINSIEVGDEPVFPGNEEMERAYRKWIRWNAAIMVHRAQAPGIGVGGHISTYAGASTLYEVGFNHFFRGQDHPGGGDQVFFQGHASPGMYARAFLEGRLSEEQMDGFRQEKSKAPYGLSSYPHPRLLPEFWQFPTVSMGLGPANAIYQAQFNRYLQNRGIKDTSEQHVWAFLGDGEMDEPESRGFLQLAANENLDNLTFVINCNLQRLDGPVRGNGKIMQELESFFRGAGWNVIKVVWGREWDELLAKDDEGALVDIMNSTPDGDYQTYKAESGAFVREHFFGKDPRTKDMVADMTDEAIWNLKRGGHDYRKVYAAYKEATEHKGQPTVVLAATVKGYGLGTHFEGRNATHQMKKLTLDDLKAFRDHLRIPISDEELEKDPYRPPYYNPGADAPEIQYMMTRRHALGGFVPERRTAGTELALPGDKAYQAGARGSGSQQAATTMAFVRLLKDLMRDKEFGKRIVPIVPDESRTFGMDSFFPTAKIYNPHGQNYLSVDRELVLAYKESPQGQLIHPGINETGAVSAFTAAGTSYSTHGEAMIPVYVFYSMFGFQRSGDSFWAAGDQMARGFVIGATAGRTTLTGEGLQHADGHSHLLAATNPAVVAYDPAYGYEIGHIMRSGLERMYGGKHPDPNVMYYLTVYNEPYVQPAEPADVDVDGIVRGIHKVAPAADLGADAPKAQLMASGVAVPWTIEAQRLLAEDWGVAADVWSVTSWNELARDGQHADASEFADGDERTAYVTTKLQGADGPFVAVSDHQRAVPEQLRPYIPGDYSVLGADGFGFSDTRAAARRFFRIDAHTVVVKALQRLGKLGKVDAGLWRKAYEQYKIDEVTAGTSGNAGGDA